LLKQPCPRLVTVAGIVKFDKLLQPLKQLSSKEVIFPLIVMDVISLQFIKQAELIEFTLLGIIIDNKDVQLSKHCGPIELTFEVDVNVIDDKLVHPAKQYPAIEVQDVPITTLTT
jgi:hypothetical protein